MKSLFKSFDFDKKDIDTYFLLLSAPLLLTLYICYGQAKDFTTYFPQYTGHQLEGYYGQIYQFISFFILMFIIPFLYLKLKMKKPLIEFGLGLGDWKFGLIICLITIPFIIIPFTYSGTRMSDIQNVYPMARVLLDRHDLILQYELVYIIFYYIAWEFFFRGFLLFGLKDRFGAMNAILIQTISSCLIHIGKPDGEIIGSIIFGIIMGVIAIRTKSFWYPLLIHLTMGVLTDIFIIYLK
ncbi:MAG: CPBP family glutamic-type intramembrane protease [Bacteroidetes bacterium]|nr:CPBP family glutamic-type intramembrane protease [Bacteroidota bacterium]